MALYFVQEKLGVPTESTPEHNEYSTYCKKYFRRVKRCLKCQEIKREDILRGDNYIGGRHCKLHQKQYPVYSFDVELDRSADLVRFVRTNGVVGKG